MNLPRNTEVHSIYVHIPFCSKICPFCAFAVKKDEPKEHRDYLKSLILELRHYIQHFEIDLSHLRCLYLGGGTPSKLTIQELEFFFQELNKHLDFSFLEQITMELNPEDCSLEYLKNLKTLPINRLSIGVQSFQKQSLRKLGRIHNEEQSHVSIEAIHAAGFDDFNIDLMFGWLGQDIELLNKDLNLFLSATPTHISSYCLNLEENTPFGRSTIWNKWVTDNENLISEMYELIISRLHSNGFEQYEVSNFSLEGKRSMSNTLVWKGKNYLGIGSGAHSFISPFRFANERNSEIYQDEINKGRLKLEYCEELADRQIGEEKLMVGFRLSEGLLLRDVENYTRILSSQFLQIIQPLITKNLISLDTERISLTAKGMLVADEIAAWILSRF